MESYDILSTCLQPDTPDMRPPSRRPASRGRHDPVSALLRVPYLHLVLGGLVGYVVDGRYPGPGSLVTVAVFMIALWGAWILSVRITERYWPEPPAA